MLDSGEASGNRANKWLATWGMSAQYVRPVSKAHQTDNDLFCE